MQVAAGADLEVHHGMAPKAFQHVIEKADAGVDVARPRAVKVQGDGYLGFAGFALNSGGTHRIPLISGLYSSGHRPRESLCR